MKYLTLGAALVLHHVPAHSDIYVPLFTVSSGSFRGGWWDGPSQSTGLNWTIEDNSLNTERNFGMYNGFENSYIPFSGEFSLGVFVCGGNAPSGPARCTVNLATSVLHSRPVFLSSDKLITAQNPVFNAPAGTHIPGHSSVCYAFVDTSGHAWSTSAPRTCQDAGKLPETPAVCYLNANADLNVALGTLERGSITTTPAAGSPGNMKKDVPVLCTRDAGTTVSTTFQYTPVTFNGHEVISTPSNGLGVAVFYKGQLVGPSSAPITETFALGETVREFEFQAVRDPAVALKDIPTGNFTASATMVMTQQ